MAVDIRSQEFATAWRVVSEALLAALQGGEFKLSDVVSVVDSVGVEPARPIESIRPQKVSEEPQRRTVNNIVYAVNPVKQQNGTYLFKNLKEEKQDNSIYKITRYTDGSCEFELCDLQGEIKQIFKDSLANVMPSSVGTYEGEITAESYIKTIISGKGVEDGRSVRITEPLKAEFKIID